MKWFVVLCVVAALAAGAVLTGSAAGLGFGRDDASFATADSVAVSGSPMLASFDAQPEAVEGSAAESTSTAVEVPPVAESVEVPPVAGNVEDPPVADNIAAAVADEPNVAEPVEELRPLISTDAAPDAASVSGGPAAAPAPGHSGHVSAEAKRKSKLDLPDDVAYVSFEKLASFWYEPPDPDLDDLDAREDPIPAPIKELGGHKSAVEGYMVPIAVEDGRVTSFILSRFFSACCFGQMPEMNEWVEVDVAGEEGFDYLPYGSVLVIGEFEVGEVFDDYGYVRSIYRMKAESVQEQW